MHTCFKKTKIQDTVYNISNEIIQNYFNVYTNNSTEYIFRIHYRIRFEVSKSNVFGFKILIPVFIIQETYISKVFLVTKLTHNSKTI